jgi:tetratricopeptide (TPR) repeat protein
MGKRPPTLEVVCHKTLSKKLALKGVALRRMQIQEQWLSKGTNYDESKHSILTASTTGTSDDSNSIPDDISELSYDESPPLIMGADAAPDQEVVFWTTNCQDQVKTHGSQHSRTGIAFLNKGIAELNVRQTGMAIESFLTAVQLLQERHGESHLAVGRAMHLLGSAFFLDGQLPMAVDATRKAFDIRKEILGAWHTDTVDTFSNLAMVYLRMDRLVEAARIFNEVLKIRKVIYDPYHPSVAFPSRSLGCVYAKRQDLERAKKNYVHALDCFQAHLMLAEQSDTQAEMRRFGIEPPEPKADARLEI